jgi:DNA-directed RNA polymerase subunit alpha
MISLNQFVIKKTGEGENQATFEIGPLPKGFGHTLGNYLRRTLLSAIPGTSITSVKINGIQHEYSKMEGLSDDILAVILSLKNVVLNSKTLEPVTLDINVTGEEGKVKEVRAGDISPDSNIEIINPEYVITRLTGKAKFVAQIVVERGIGYFYQNEDVRKELGMLPVDANFSPVKLVNYEITPARVGKETELDQLNLTIQTNGSITPIEALHIASDTLSQATNHLVEMTEQMLNGKEVSVTLSRQQRQREEAVATPVSQSPIRVVDLNLSTRLTNALLKSNYDDLRKLEGLTEEEVANIRGMGSKSFEELLAILKKYDIKLV